MNVADQPEAPGARRPAGEGIIHSDAVRNITLGDLLREAARYSGHRIALVDGVADPALRRRWTYAELLEAAEQVAHALLARFRPGDRIAMCSPNCPEWVILQFGVALAGMMLVPTNPAYREAELAGILKDCGASAFFHADAWRGNDIAASAAAIRKTALPDLATFSLSQWTEFLAGGASPVPLPPVRPRDPVVIQFTSGTTGRPKGAILHHGVIDPPRHVAERCGFPDYGVWLNSMPMYHIAGSTVSLLATVASHGAFVLMREWDSGLALELIEVERCSGMLLVPTMILGILDHPDFARRDLSSIVFILSGGAPVPPALVELVTQRIGCRLMICFGLTES